jgi:hypothetical protein
MIQELATKIMNAPVDYKKSMFKHKPDRITLFGDKMTLEDLEKVRREQNEAAHFIKRAREKAEEEMNSL